MMNTFIFILYAFSLCSHLASAEVFNNYNNARLIQATAIVPANGDYVFTNVGTGEVIQHDRKDNVPNVFATNFRKLKKAKRPQLTITGHRGGTKWLSLRTPTVAADEGKCISAQWNEKVDGGSDHAGTLYECVVDPLNLGASLEKTKQWWLLMPVKTAKLLTVASSSSRVVEPAASTSRVVSDKQDTKSSEKTMPFWNTKTNRMEPLPAWKYDKRDLKSNQVPDWEDEHSEGESPKPVKNESHNFGELDSHEPRMPEKSMIEGTRSIRKHHARSTHKIQKNKKNEAVTKKLGPFYIVAVDHLYDMETRVWTSQEKKTIGNQLSLVMENLNPNDKTQQWYLETE